MKNGGTCSTGGRKHRANSAASRISEVKVKTNNQSIKQLYKSTLLFPGNISTH